MNNNSKITSLTTKIETSFDNVRSIVNASSRYWGSRQKFEEERQKENEDAKKKIIELTYDHSSSDASSSD